MKTSGLIIANYNSNGMLTDDILKLCESIKDEYVIVISYIGKIQNLNSLDPSIIHLNYGEKGYDLNCYKQGMNYFFKSHKKLSRFLFMNNSIEIVNISKFRSLLQNKVEQLEANHFVGFTKNYEIRPHYQTFLFGFSTVGLNTEVLRLLKKCLARNPRYSRMDVIEKFELETITMLNRYGLKHTHVYQPDYLDVIRGFLSYLLQFGFIDNFEPINKMNPMLINPSTFLKRHLTLCFGLKKKKSTTVVNKIFKK